jgi:hypothetical protein
VGPLAAVADTAFAQEQVESAARIETVETDDQQSSAIALGSLLLLGKATLCVYVGRVAAPRDQQQR